MGQLCSKDTVTVANQSSRKGKGTKSCTKPIGIESLRWDNYSNKWFFSSPQSVRNVKVVCDIMYVRGLWQLGDGRWRAAFFHSGTYNLPVKTHFILSVTSASTWINGTSLWSYAV